MSNIDWDAVFGVIVCSVVVLLLLFGGTAAVLSARASGEPDYCMPIGTTGGYQLQAHRPWSSTAVLGTFSTFTETVAAAEQLHCPFRIANP